MILFDKDEYGYKLVDNDYNKIIMRIKEPCICFSYSTSLGGCLHKFGDYDLVKDWYDTARKKYIDAEYPNEAEELKLLYGSIPVEELNKCIEISGYIGKLYEKSSHM